MYSFARINGIIEKSTISNEHINQTFENLIANPANVSFTKVVDQQPIRDQDLNHIYVYQNQKCTFFFGKMILARAPGSQASSAQVRHSPQPSIKTHK